MPTQFIVPLAEGKSVASIGALSVPKYLSLDAEGASQTNVAGLGARVVLRFLAAQGENAQTVRTIVGVPFAVAITGNGDVTWLLDVPDRTSAAVAFTAQGENAVVVPALRMGLPPVQVLGAGTAMADFTPFMPAIREPEWNELRGTINLVRNASVEQTDVGLLDWSGVNGAALALDSAVSWHGARSVQVTYPVSTLWTPANLAVTARAWWRGDDIAGADNSAVASWTDASGNGYPLTQATAGVRPTLQTNELNGHSAVGFASASSQRFQVAHSFGITAQPYSIYAVWNMANSANQFLIHSTAPSGNDPGVWINAAGNLATHAGSDLAIAITKGAWRMTGHQINNTSSVVVIDGNTRTTGAAGTQAPANTNTAVGSIDIGTSLYLNGMVAEMLVVPQAVSQANEDLIFGYFAWKYGLTASLPVGHPYKSAAPTTTIADARVAVKSEHGLSLTGQLNAAMVGSLWALGSITFVQARITATYTDATTDTATGDLFDLAAVTDWVRVVTPSLTINPAKVLDFLTLDLMHPIADTVTVIHVDGAQVEQDRGEGATPFAQGDMGEAFAWLGPVGLSMSLRETMAVVV